MKTIQTEIHIAATPRTVWSILTDLQRYPDWNPFIISAQGALTPGQKLTVRIAPPGRKPITFKPTVKSVGEDHELRWLGHLLCPGLLDGRHAFLIKPTPTGCLFTQTESFRGLLLPLIWKSLNPPTQAGFHLMNKALKARAESTPQ